MSSTSSAAAVRRRLVAWALALAGAVLASSAAAQAPAEGADRAPPPQLAPSAPPAAPAVEELPPQAMWEATVAAYEARIEALKYEADAVHDFVEAEDVRDARGRQIELELEATKRELRNFMERTTERNSTVMMVSGIVLAGLGAAALVTGAVLITAKHDEAATKHRDTYTVAVATAAGGAAAVGVGLPLYVIGKKRVLRKGLELRGLAAARLLVGPGAVAASPGAVPLGVGLRIAF
ncbi:hypothetical protein [Sorangium cellulosum]|uniref:hypothetical protein n=1 Tax=Sorangium cellulosum TaxID=56 RepID=UPI0012FF9C5E|nr:hypothetical protein [Sorangium cellulosum]